MARVARATAVVDAGRRHVLPEQPYQLQYAHMYYQRLTDLRPAVLAQAHSLWSGKARHVEKALDMPPNELCYVVGLVYADLPLKPNVLDDLAQDRYIHPPPPRTKYTSDKDTYVLEDDSGRLTLVGDRVKSELLITGIVCGVLGTQLDGGEIAVQDFCFPSVAPQAPLPPAGGESKYILLVSGLQVGAKGSNPLLTQLLAEFVTGQVGDVNQAARIARVVVAGGSIKAAEPAQHAIGMSTKDKATAAAALISESSAAMRSLDDLLRELCGSLPVDLMPGPGDPASHNIPQQPMFRALFPNSKVLSTLSLVTNPYEFSADGLYFLGTSGQNVDDLFMYVNETDRMALLEAMLRWRHIAPTAPDTLGSVPVSDEDPFVVKESPHVFFAGGQPSFESKVVNLPDGQQILIVCVPTFATTGTAVLVDISNLTATPVTLRPWDAAF